MALKEANMVQMRAQGAIAALSPVKMPGAPGSVNVQLGMGSLKTFSSDADADAYVARLEAALKPFRDEIEAQAVADIKAALA